MPLRYPIFMVLLFFGPYGAGQLRGKIVDQATEEGLEYATAALYRQLDSTLVNGVVTDSSGVFRFGQLESATYYLELSFLGYNTSHLYDIRITTGTVPLDIGTVGLEMVSQQLSGVVVEGERATVSNKIDRQVFDAGKFQNARGGTITDLLRNLPSVSVDGLGEISVRGSTGFVLLINGKPIQGSASVFLNQLPANSVERIEVITAPSAKYDPEGKAGILNIILNRASLDGNFAQLNVRAGLPSVEPYDNANAARRYGLDATYNIRKKKWNISLGANYQRNDISGRREGDVFTIRNDTLTRFPSDGERSFDELNFSGRFTVDYEPDTLNLFSLGFYAGERQRDRTADILYFDNHAITPANGGDRLYTFQYFNANLRERIGDFFLGSFDYAHTFANTSRLSTSLLFEYTLLGGPTTNRNLGFPDTEIVFQDEFNTNDNPLNGFRAQLDYVWKPFSFGALETGYQYRILDHNGDFLYERRNTTTGEFELVPEFSSAVDLRREIHSFYAQLSGVKGKWEYTTGLRMEVMDRDFELRDRASTIDTTYTYNFVKPFPSLSVLYSLDERTKVRAAYSKRVERTTTFKMNPFPEREHSETLEQGDAELLPEFIDLVELGITKNLEGDQSLFATLYLRNVQNLVNRVNTVFNDTILNRIYSNVGRGRALGMELGAQLKPSKDWSNFIGGNVYSYAIDGIFDDREVRSNSLIYSFNANSTYSFSETASLQFTFNYLSAQNTAQGEDSRFYSPNLTFRKTFLKDRLVATLQWQNMDLGLLNTNEQRITTERPGAFFTTTNYVYEVDIILLNLTYSFNKNTNRAKFIDSEFGKREF